MDVAVAKELLRNTIAASRELGRNEDRIPIWENMLAKMPDYMIDDRGIIKEWLTPRLENRDSHRHSSQLYPLFDGMPEEIAQSPELQAAFRKSIEYKLDKHWKNNQRGFMSFGLVQFGQAATSLGEGRTRLPLPEAPREPVLAEQPGLDAQPPLAVQHGHQRRHAGRDHQDAGGLRPRQNPTPAGAARAWPSGRIEGVLCRGAIEIQCLQWERKQIEVTLSSAKSQTVVLELPSQISQLSITSGAAKAGPADSANQRTIDLPSGQSVALVIKLK